MYRSGDLGYILPNGNIAFLHRKDDQIMIYGKRVELAEPAHVSNFTDFAPLAAEPDVRLRQVRTREEWGNPDLVLKVVSGSMEPSIHEGDYIYIKKTDTDSLKAGDIISFYSQDDSIKGEINTHRISEVLSDGTFVTKGEPIANPFG